jgi:antitoxin (DNA-binding transcriptional repressor) of toxin-antitoxin stability system
MKVISGEKFIITKHGVQVAMIIPFSQKKEKVDSVNDVIRSFSKKEGVADEQEFVI